MAEAIRTQNWFTVAIEFIIVVTGIFVGLQVSDWSKERDNRALERAAIERLFVEAQDAHELVSFSADRMARLNRVRRMAVAFFSGDAPLPENTLPLKIGANNMAQFPRIQPVTSTYDELTSSGQMQLIRSSELRAIVSNFHASLGVHNTLQTDFSRSSDEYWTAFRRNVIWRYNPEEPRGDIVLSTFNWQAMREDEDFIFQLIGMLRNQLVATRAINGLQAQAKAMCDALGIAVGSTCDVQKAEADAKAAS